MDGFLSPGIGGGLRFVWCLLEYSSAGGTCHGIDHAAGGNVIVNKGSKSHVSSSVSLS